MPIARRSIEYYTINAKVLPAAPKGADRYSQLIENWFNKGYKIMHEGDNSHYFTLTSIDKIADGNDVVYYGVLSKFVKIDELDFIDKETRKLVEYELPANIEARSQQYEFIFVPGCHRFAFVKVGKIDPEIKKKGAPLKQIMNIIKQAFDAGISDGNTTFVEIAQDPLVFTDIYTNRVLSLKVRVTYTNDDNLNAESKKLMDRLLKTGGIAEMLSRMTPVHNGQIDSSSDLANGLIGLARENGEVNALIEYPNGAQRRINTKDHPEVNDLSFDSENASKANFLLGILNRFVKRYIVD